MPPVQGSYKLFGNDTRMFGEAELAERLRVGFVFQGGQLVQPVDDRRKRRAAVAISSKFAAGGGGARGGGAAGTDGTDAAGRRDAGECQRPTGGSARRWRGR